MGEAAEEFETFIDLVAGERLQALGAEFLDGEGTHYAPVEHRVLEHKRSDFALRCHVAHEASGERIPGASRIMYLLDGQCRCAKWVMRSETERAFTEE